MSYLFSTFGETIRELRKSKGLSQEDLADLCGLHRTYISGIELGNRNINLINILVLTAAFEVLPCDLFHKFDEKTIAKFRENGFDSTLPRSDYESLKI